MVSECSYFKSAVRNGVGTDVSREMLAGNDKRRARRELRWTYRLLALASTGILLAGLISMFKEDSWLTVAL